MPLVIAYARETAFSPKPERAAPEIRAVAAQVRRQIPRAPDELALTLPALVETCRRVEVNGRCLAVSWELDRALSDEAGQDVLGLCDIDADEPGWAYLAINGVMTAHRPDLALSTAAHELGHLLFDVPAALERGEHGYRAVAQSARALDRAGRGAEARANEFMGALLVPPVPLHTRLLAHDGAKHHAVNRAGFSIAGLVAAGELPEAEARAALRSALAGIASRCRDFGAAEATLNRAWQAGLAKPRQPSGSARP